MNHYEGDVELDERLLTPSQVADRLQVTERTIYSWLGAGSLKGIKIGRIWRIPENALQAFLNVQMSKHGGR
jgi:acetyl-CoA synthetase